MWKSRESSKPSEPVVEAPASTPQISQLPNPENKAASCSECALIGKSMIVKGEISGTERLHIEGRVEGSIKLPHCYISIAAGASVHANIEAAEVVIHGDYVGNLNTSNRVDVRSGASVHGDVITGRLIIQEGASFRGMIEMVRPSQNGNRPAKSVVVEQPALPVAQDAASAVENCVSFAPEKKLPVPEREFPAPRKLGYGDIGRNAMKNFK
jgi:cytoskeletal protein CcmA (bactofilin family)